MPYPTVDGRSWEKLDGRRCHLRFGHLRRLLLITCWTAWRASPAYWTLPMARMNLRSRLCSISFIHGVGFGKLKTIPRCTRWMRRPRAPLKPTSTTHSPFCCMRSGCESAHRQRAPALDICANNSPAGTRYNALLTLLLGRQAQPQSVVSSPVVHRLSGPLLPAGEARSPSDAAIEICRSFEYQLANSYAQVSVHQWAMPIALAYVSLDPTAPVAVWTLAKIHSARDSQSIAWLLHIGRMSGDTREATSSIFACWPSRRTQP